MALRCILTGLISLLVARESLGSGLPGTVGAWPENCPCGVMGAAARMVGGAEVGERELPWLVKIETHYQENGLHYTSNCGGTVVSPRHIITAKHCIDQPKTPSFYVEAFVGANDIHDPQAKRVPVKNIILYDDTSVDVALLELHDPLQFSDRVRPLCLPAPAQDYTGMTGVKAGWGITEEGAKTRPTLPTKVNLKIKHKKFCTGKYEPMIFCTYTTNGHDGCNGDSGTGFAVQRGNRYELAGVYYAGNPICGGPGLSWFVDGSAIVGWIRSTVQQSGDSFACAASPATTESSGRRPSTRRPAFHWD